MPPAQVMVMRHAEKLGDPDDPNLSAAGQARAAALVRWYPATFGRPASIFATAMSKHSERPIQTVRPLAEDLGIAIDDTFADQDYGALAEALVSRPELSGRAILVCWHHGNIPGLMMALGATAGDYPDPWNRDVFNLVLVADFAIGSPPPIKMVLEPF